MVKQKSSDEDFRARSLSQRSRKHALTCLRSRLSTSRYIQEPSSVGCSKDQRTQTGLGELSWHQNVSHQEPAET